jgi:hypothetical protein
LCDEPWIAVTTLARRRNIGSENRSADGTDADPFTLAWQPAIRSTFD